MTALLLILAVGALIALFYVGRGYWAWLAAALLVFAAWAVAGIETPAAFSALGALAVVLALAFGLPLIRRPLISAPLMRLARRAMPRVSETERAALEAGTVWWDGALFSGDPDWRKLLDFQVRPLSEREQAFLDGPVETLCAMIDDWRVWQDRDLSPEVWDYLKRERFFGMIIPESYGGLGFSAIAHSAVVAKVASRSIPAACTLMVPNSLGPAELLLRYGTEAQKDHYLPRLARGEDVPCFALTEPHAGSDAASTRSRGVVCRGTYDGEEVLGIRLDWNKRYITLAPVATVIGLAFRLYDPERLLGGEEDLGITCALIPPDLPGIEIGARHDPMGVPFQNGPIVGRDVFVPLDAVIGGREGVGRGWRMLMDCLAAGRSISLPSLSVAAVELAARTTGAYATLREQFNLPIGRFEGIEEPLARIAGHAYFMNAARRLTCGAVDDGEQPAVLSAVVKAYLTEGMRASVNDAMDVLAGAAICRGPRNALGRCFTAMPIAITVEGANILTRSLIVFGQGSVRCHPFVHDEMAAIADGDLARFDRALFGHIGFFARNAVRAPLLALTGGWLARAPVADDTARRFRAFTRQAAAFALLTDVALLTLGGGLKRREKISGRLADALAWLYLGSATLKRFHDEGRPEEDAAVMAWSCDLALYRIEDALRGVLDNLPNRFAAGVARGLIFPLGARRRPPSDALGGRVARAMLDGGALRERLTTEIFVPPLQEDGLGRIEASLRSVLAAQPDRDRIRAALRAGTLERAPKDTLVERARAAGVIDAEAEARIEAAEADRDAVIQVDSFAAERYATLKG